MSRRPDRGDVERWADEVAEVGERNEKIRHVVEMAIRRHLDHPPPPPKPPKVIPLPPLPATDEAAATAKPKKTHAAKQSK